MRGGIWPEHSNIDNIMGRGFVDFTEIIYKFNVVSILVLAEKSNVSY